MDGTTTSAGEAGGESKRARVLCPVPGCVFTGCQAQVEVHWRYIHDSSVILYQCPVPKCRTRLREEQLREGHWRRAHHLTSVQAMQMAAPPPLAELRGNNQFRHPGAMPAPVGPLGLPEGALPFSRKLSLQTQVEAIISGTMVEQPVVGAESTCEAHGFLNEVFEVVVWGQPAGMTAASTTASTVPTPALATSSTLTPSPDQELEEIEGEIGRLQECRRRLQLQATLGHLQRIARAEGELATARQRVQQPEAQLGEVRASTTAASSLTVATLERFPITRGLILFPCLQRGQPPVATVYPLGPDDVALLQLNQRDPLLSCEQI